MAGLQKEGEDLTARYAWQVEHVEVISRFLKYLNETTGNFILKGGTALMACYGLDRFSADIDLDGTTGGIEKIVREFCEKQGFTFRTAKDTDTVKRYMINYGNDGKPLKVETSFRKKVIPPVEVVNIGGVAVYKIDSLCAMKASAYAGRDKIRDLYDLVFICNNYWDELSDQIISVVRNAVEFKGIEQFDFLIKDQRDELVDKNRLADEFLKMYDNLGLLCDERERQIIAENLDKTL